MERSRLESAGRGRPRSAASHAAILDAAIALTREVGFDALAMEAVAARAGVGKATVYRWWNTREALLAEAVDRIVQSAPEPDTGTVEGDLIDIVGRTAGMYRDPASAALMSALVAAMARSTQVAKAVRGSFVASRREAMRRALQRGVARGELRADLDADLALDLLSGPLMFRTLVSGGSPDAAFVRGIVTTVVRGLAPPTQPEGVSRP
jgi:AcrR family transcriptional regulator